MTEPGVPDRSGHESSGHETAADPGAGPAVVRLAIGGMRCASCQHAITHVLAAHPDVRAATVSLGDESARVEVDPEAAHAATLTQDLIERVRRAGYQAWPHGQEPGAAGGEAARVAARERASGAARRFWTALALSAPILPLMHWLPGQPLWQGLFALAVQLGPGRVFYASALRSLRARAPNMDLLIVVGTTAALVQSTAAALGWLGSGQPVFFESAAFLITFVSLGKWLEERARHRARRALLALLDLAPARARRLRNGRVEEVPAAELRPGEHVQVLPGERIPADGIVRRGHSAVDESLLTGESLPVERGAWDAVVGGSINRSAPLEIEITATGADTAVARIVRLVRAALEHPPPIQRLADRVSAVFVPAVLVLALAVGLLWSFALGADPPRAILHAITVVVIACPCALGLATPTALLVGSGLALRHGLLLRNAAALETLARVDRLLVDKTGTLTTGVFAVNAVEVAPGQDAAALLQTAGAVASLSQHPLAMAIAEGARAERESAAREEGAPAAGVGSAREAESPPRVETVREEAGLGLVAQTSRGAVLLGRAQWLAQQGVALDGALLAAGSPSAPQTNASPDIASPAIASPANASPANASLTAAAPTIASPVTAAPTPSSSSPTALPPGSSAVHVAIAGRHAGVIGLADTLRPQAAAVLAALRAEGITPVLVTGDQPGAAHAVASALGIDEVRAGLLPGEKQQAVHDEQRRGHAVAMVGDGINDAPALAAADVGLVIGSGTDLAKETGDVVLMRSELSSILHARRLARATLRKIRENLGWAFAYNLLGIPIAAGALMPWGIALAPEHAGLAMALSSVSVVLNSLRLGRQEARIFAPLYPHGPEETVTAPPARAAVPA